MKVSLNWLRELGAKGLDVPVDELVERIGAQLGAVEEVIDLGKKYQGIVIAKVVSCVDHPNADRLHVCIIDDGGITPDVKRDEQGHVQVVCGAPNVREGLLVAWLPPGATVPDSVDSEPFVLEARELRGVVSNGMLASEKELSLSDNHDGILEIDPNQWSPTGAEIKPGADFATIFGLNDHIIDIENKMFTHRPDCFGQIGIAREVSGISGQQYTSPDWYVKSPDFPAGEGLALEVINESPEVVPRFMTLAMKDVKIAPSPLWLQCALIRVGAKPINNVVDVTNYVMLLTGQPTHAYDYDKVRGHQLIARLAKPGEKVTLLNHKTYELDPADIVIADGDGPIGLGGVMGGGDSEVSDDTRNIVLECANFDMYAVRRSSMRHGVFTDALTRFNKGQSPLQNAHVLHLLMQSIQDIAGGAAAGPVVDINKHADRQWVHPPVPVTDSFVNARLGLELNATDMKRLLENVECSVDVHDNKLTVSAPFWRTDIETREDVVEEIGRLYGYDKLPLVLPERSIRPAVVDSILNLKDVMRRRLATAGANEVLTYSFTHSDLFQKARQDIAHAFQLGNAISPDLQYYRTTLTPSLLDKVHANIKAGYERFALFEFGKVHYLGEDEPDEPGVPLEDNHLGLVVTASKPTDKASPYYLAQKYLREIVGPTIGLTPLKDFDLSSDEWGRNLVAPYEPGRASVIIRDGKIWGVVGELRTSVRRLLKLPSYTAALEVNLGVVKMPSRHYAQLSRFPSVWQDITLKVATETTYGSLYDALTASVQSTDELHAEVRPLGIYQSADDATTKNISFRLTVTSYARTLTDSEVNTMLDTAAAQAHESVGAERI